MTLFEQMQAAEHFTGSEAAIISYILEHQADFEELTIQELAKATYSSNATIIRLCKKLGCKGYREFHAEFLREIEMRRHITTQVDYDAPFQMDDSAQDILHGMFSLYDDGIRLINASLTPRALLEAVSCLTKANHIFLLGYGDVRLSLKSFSNLLAKIGIYCVLVTDNYEESRIIPQITKDDCILILSYSGLNPGRDGIISLMRHCPAPKVVITGNESSQLAGLATVLISFPQKEAMPAEDKISTFYSQLAFQYILNVLYAMIYKKKKKRSPPMN